MSTKTLTIVRNFLDPIDSLVLEKLVEELTEARLSSFCDVLLKELTNERRQLQDEISQSHFSSLNIVEFERNLDYLVEKSFVRDLGDTKFQLPDLLRYCIGQIFFCKNSLERVLEYLKGDFGQMLASKQSVEAPVEGPGWTRIGRYNQMLRYFVRFLQERAILRELTDDYDYWFETALGISAGQTELPPGRRPPSKQSMQLNDFAAASRDLLLEGTTGRFASPPLIRAVIELALIRSFLELPKYSSKHKTKTIETTQIFRLADLMANCNKQAVRVFLNPNNLLIEAIYKWGNETVHKGKTFPMEQIVYCHSIVDDLANERLGPMFKATSTQIDSLLDTLERDGEIILK